MTSRPSGTGQAVEKVRTVLGSAAAAAKSLQWCPTLSNPIGKIKKPMFLRMLGVIPTGMEKRRVWVLEA